MGYERHIRCVPVIDNSAKTDGLAEGFAELSTGGVDINSHTHPNKPILDDLTVSEIENTIGNKGQIFNIPLTVEEW